MDVLRAAVGDAKLTFVGHSYGSFLGATYANLFPQRVRAIALDGVLDPVGWMTGRGPLDAATPFSLRVGSQQATSRALRYFLDTCKQAGPRCAFSDGDPVEEFDAPDGPAARGADRAVHVRRRGQHHARRARVHARLAVDGRGAGRGARREHPGREEPRRRGAGPDDAKLAIACSETANPPFAGVWPLAARVADHFTPYFGASWAYISQACATWPARDADRYAGPFDRKTAAPLLLVNSRFDAASSYERAQVVERTLGSARLLTIEGAGHTQATIDSPCADAAIERYLIAGALPAPGAVCADQRDPWAE